MRNLSILLSREGYKSRETRLQQSCLSIIWQTTSLFALLSLASTATAATTSTYQFVNTGATSTNAVTIQGGSSCSLAPDDKTPLKLEASINGNMANFLVSKQDGTSFLYDGTMDITVGSYKNEPYVITRAPSVRILASQNIKKFAVGAHDLSLFDKEMYNDPAGKWHGGYPKYLYARYKFYNPTLKQDLCLWAGPIVISQMDATSSSSGTSNSGTPTYSTTVVPNQPSEVTLVYPTNGMTVEESSLSITANVSDPEGVKACLATLTDKNGLSKDIPLSLGDSKYRCVGTADFGALGLADGNISVKVKVTDATGKEETPPNATATFTKLGGCNTRTSTTDNAPPTADFTSKYPIKPIYRIGSLANPTLSNYFEYEIAASDNIALQSLSFTIKDNTGKNMYSRSFNMYGTTATTGGYGIPLDRNAWTPEQDYIYSIKATDAANLCFERTGVFKVAEPAPDVVFTSPLSEVKAYYGLLVPVSGKAITADGVKTIAISMFDSSNNKLIDTQQASTYAPTGGPVEEEFYKSFNPAVAGVAEGSILKTTVTVTDTTGKDTKFDAPPFKWCRTETSCPTPVVVDAPIPVVNNVIPTASFSLDKVTGVTPLAVIVTKNESADADGSIVKYDWKTSDGQVSTEVTPKFTFAKAGENTITLIVTDDKGAASLAVNKTVTVTAAQPTSSSTYKLIYSQIGFGNTLWNITDGPGKILMGTSGGIITREFNAGTTITFSKNTSAPDVFFYGFTGDPCSNLDTCTITMDRDYVIASTFSGMANGHFTFARIGEGDVTDGHNIIKSGASLSNSTNALYYPQGLVTLIATPSTGFAFKRWIGGDCNNSTLSTCKTMFNGTSQTVVAIFDTIPAAPQQATLTVTTPTDGSVSNDKITCGTVCTADYALNTPVTLTALPASQDFAASAWQGCDTVSTDKLSCQVTMNGAKNVSVTFSKVPATTSGSGSTATNQPQTTKMTDCDPVYDAKSKSFMVYVILPLQNSMNGADTGLFNMFKATLKEVYNKPYHYTAPTVVVADPQPKVECQPEIALITTNGSVKVHIPHVAVPEYTTVGAKQIQTGNALYEVDLKWMEADKNFMLETVKRLP